MSSAKFYGLKMDEDYLMRMPKPYKKLLKRESDFTGRSMNWLLNNAIREKYPELKIEDKIKK